ncbi:cytosolic sulfotransferase 12-like [Vitis riparia]|uniref:cytosolic sulfotransferase 12-like n=1 Tax=Vitis riparia TaxID=96939 RepID=UPI00155AF4BC|nr:cytosolic sulfotransferase 12-like [Vitis riparia]
MSSSQLPLPLPEYLQEDEVTQEHRDLLSSLPREKGWVTSHLFQYQGFWHTSRHLKGVVACQQHFQAHDPDILLVTTPKSGTTWLKAMAFALLKRVRFPDARHHPLLTNNPHELVPFLEIKLYAESKVPDLTSFTPPRLFSTHLPFTSLPESVNTSGCKLVYLCRNPRDTFVSFWQFTNKLRLENMGTNLLEEVFDKFCRGVSLSGPFWDHVLGYWKESLEKPEKILFLKYEEMKAQPHVQLRRLAEFLGCPFCPEEETRCVVDEILQLCSFENLSNLEVNKNGKLSSGEEHSAFFRRGQVGDWVNYLTAEMLDRLDHITEEKLHGSGLKFEVS